MTNYSKTTNFTAKDSLVSGDANKIVKGSEIDAEFDNIATASATKANIASPVFTGVVSFPDGSAGDPSITNTGDTNTGLFFSAADTLSFTAAGTAQFTMSDGVIAPVTDADVDLGTSSLEFKDAYFDGTVHTDAINLNGTAITSTAAELNILDGKAFLDEDDMSSNSATGIASQQSIKAYVDAQITAEDLDFQADSGGALSIDLDSETLTFTGGTGVDTSGSGNAVTFAIDSTVATLTGTQTLTNKTLTSPTLNTPTIGTSFTIGSATITEAELEILDGATVTTAELNVLDGITSTTAELNILDGVTSTAAELNILDGVTATAAELNILDGVTSTAAELNILDGVTSTTAELNILDGVTATTAELNYVDGVTSAIQTQIDAKAPLASPTFTGTVNAAALTVNSGATDLTATFQSTDQFADIKLTDSGGSSFIRQSNGSLLLQADRDNATASSIIQMSIDNTEAMRVDSSGNVGIGTTSASGALHVSRSGLEAGITLERTSSATAKFTIAANDGNLTFTDAANSAERMRIDSSGNVGIGTTSPSTYGVDGAEDLVIGQADGDHGLTISSFNSSNGTIAFSDVTNASVGRGFFDYDHNVDAMAVGTAGAERLRIDSSGNLLVGKTSSAINTDGVELLNSGRMFLTTTSLAHVIRRKSTDGSLIEFQKDTATVGSIGVEGGRPYFANDDTGGFSISSAGSIIPATATGAVSDASKDLGISSARFKDFYLSGAAYIPDVRSTGIQYFTHTTDVRFRTAGGTERLRIDSSGNLLVGGTAYPDGSVSNWGLNNSGQSASSRATTGASVHHSFYNSNGLVGTIQTSGSSTAYNTSSDQRLKDNIVDAPSASDDIDAIQVRSFDWKSDGSHQKYGMVAQELQSVAPEAVSGDADSEEMMGVDYSKLVPIMLKEIQSLRARVAQLENN